MAADEIRSGSFIYRDTLFAEVSEGKRHPRASASELKDLLLPKKNAPPAKDQVAHWYEAQLIHYGLPRVKDKNAAKVRLLGAINAGSLVVPGHLQQVEADLKRQYAGSQRKAKNAAKKVEAAGPAAAGKKRKAAELEGSAPSGMRTKMSISVDGMKIDIDRQAATAVATPTKKQKSSTTQKNTTKATSPTKKAAAAPKASKKVTASTAPAATTTPSRVRPKQTARRSVPFPSTSQSRTTTTARTPIHIDDDEPPPAYTEYENENDYPDSDILSPRHNNVVQISGSYNISTDMYPSQCDLQLRLSHPRDQLWGRFSIGYNTGIIRLDGLSQLGMDPSVRKTFGWRSEDEDTGALQFRKDCEGWIQLDGEGGVNGVFYGLSEGDDVEFEGQLERDYSYEDDEERDEAVMGLRSEWDDFPRRAYRRG